jgi:hypothetical protein
LNWDAIGAIGEIVGAIAVLISLVYLALQVKKSTNLAKSSYHSATVTSASRFHHWKSLNGENARIFKIGMSDFRALSVEERIALDGALFDLVLAFADLLESYELGFLRKDVRDAWVRYIGTILSTPGGGLWWSQARNIYLEHVQEAVDSGIEQSPPLHEVMSVVFEE